MYEMIIIFIIKLQNKFEKWEAWMLKLFLINIFFWKLDKLQMINETMPQQ
jgi:hypothetical protein